MTPAERCKEVYILILWESCQIKHPHLPFEAGKVFWYQLFQGTWGLMEGVRLTGLLGKKTKMIISMAPCAVQEFVLMTQISLEEKNNHQRCSKKESLMALPCCSRTRIFPGRYETTCNIHQTFGDSYCYLSSSKCQQQLTNQSPK